MKIDAQLKKFIADEALPGTGITEAHFWEEFSRIAHLLAPRNRALLQIRDEMQAKIDVWNKAHQQKFDAAEYREFLKSIGYLVEEGADFAVTTQNVDPEIAAL